MLCCWSEEPHKRPAFKILQRELDDFENACHEKYKNYDKYLTDYGRVANRSGGKGGARPKKIKK